MKAITIRQPWASLIAAGVKTIETRPRRTGYRGRIAIHAGARHEHHGHFFMLARTARNRGLIDSETERDFRALHGPFGAVVASAVLTDCVPAENLIHESSAPKPEPWGKDHYIVDLEAQRPFGDFTPGRWALLLDDIKPTTERCPWCWGDVGGYEVADGSGGVAMHGGCRICQAHGRCDPIPARGQQAVPWEWEP